MLLRAPTFLASALLLAAGAALSACSNDSPAAFDFGPFPQDSGRIIPPGDDGSTTNPDQDGGMQQPTDSGPMTHRDALPPGYDALPNDDATPQPDGGMMTPDDSGMPMTDGGVPGMDAGFPGGPLMCTMNAPYTMGGGRCGVERWSIKTGQDTQAPSIDLTPQVTTIAALTAIPAPSPIPTDSRVAPTETTVWRLNNVHIFQSKTESDSDYHIVIDDGNMHTMIAETPYPDCAMGSPWVCFMTHARHTADSFIGMNGMTATIVGVGFFDIPHGQTGVAPNAIELHPVLALCIGQDCDPTAN